MNSFRSSLLFQYSKNQPHTFALTDYARIKCLIAPYVMRSRAHARLRGLIGWWEGDTKREKEDERLKIALGTVLSNDRVRSRLLGKHKFDAKELFQTEK